MADDAQRTLRRDAARNRERLLDAARRLFAEQGHAVPLEDVAQAAGVSRTTLYRNFTTREELAATIFEENVASIEARAAELAGRDRGIVELLDFVLDLQARNRSFARVLSDADLEWFAALSTRTVGAFRPLFDAGRAAGTVRPDVDMDDLMLAFPMAAGALADRPTPGRERTGERVRAALHRALFVTP